MANVPYHTHDFTIPTASGEQASEGTSSAVVMTPFATKQAIASEVGVTLASRGEGLLASTALQPADISTVATTGSYADLLDKPALGSAAYLASSVFATAAQGDKADSSLQIGTTTSSITEGSNLYFTGARAIASVLTGFTAGSNTAIVATDTVYGGLRKAQAQITSLFDTKLAATGTKTVSGATTFTETITVNANSPTITMTTPTNDYVVLRMKNSVGWYEQAIDPSGNLTWINRSAGGGLEGFPLTLNNDGTIALAGGAFAARPTLGGVGFALQSELTGNNYKGTYNASTNTPTLTTTPSANGDYYVVSVAGTQSITGSSTAFGPGDQIRSNGTVWQRVPSYSAVTTVAGKTGAVTLIPTDIVGLATVATTGSYADLVSKPTLGTAAAQNTTAFATSAQGAKADTALQSSTPYQVYASGFNRSVVDREKDYIVVSDLSDGSGNPSNDDAAFQAALDIISSSDANQKVILVTRPFRLLSEKNVPMNTHIKAQHGDGRIFAEAPMRSLFNFDKTALTGGGLGVKLEGLKLLNRDGNFSYAQSLLRINKLWGGGRFYIDDLECYFANKAVDWVDGDYPVFQNITTQNCVDTLYFRNNGMNGHIFGVKTVGGRAIYIDKASGGQQMEGSQFFGIQALPVGPINGQTPNGMEIKAGLKLGFFGLLIDQVAGEIGMLIDGSTNSVSAIDIYNFWVAKAENQALNSFGVFIKGASTEVNFFGGEVVFNNGVGMQIDGESHEASVSLHNIRFRLNAFLDLYANSARVKTDGCSYNSVTSIIATSSTTISGADNNFDQSIPVFNGKYNMLRNTGAASTGMSAVPTSSSGYLPGWLWKDAGNLKIT